MTAFLPYFSTLFLLVYWSCFLSVTDPICPRVLLEHLTREAIESHAFSSGHFRRGEGCTKLIRNVKSTMVEDGMQLTAKCEYGLHTLKKRSKEQFFAKFWLFTLCEML